MARAALHRGRGRLAGEAAGQGLPLMPRVRGFCAAEAGVMARELDTRGACDGGQW